MKKIDDNITYELKKFPFAVLFSLGFIVFGLIFLRLYLITTGSDNDNYLVGAIAGFALGIISFILNMKVFIKLSIKEKQAKKAIQIGDLIIAKVDGEKYEYPLGTMVICSAEIDGKKHEFIGGPVDVDIKYACQELGIEGLPVYVNMQNPKEYVVDTSEVEDRVVDLTL